MSVRYDDGRGHLLGLPVHRAPLGETGATRSGLTLCEQLGGYAGGWVNIATDQEHDLVDCRLCLELVHS